MTISWNKELETQITASFGEEQSKIIIKKYQKILPLSYLEKNSIENVITDLKLLENLNKETTLRVHLYKDQENDLRLKLFQHGKVFALSDVLPILENLDLRTIREDSYEINTGTLTFISEFLIKYKGKSDIDLAAVKILCEETIRDLLINDSEQDRLNKLILGAKLTFSEVNIIRAYIKYLKQIKFKFSRTYIEKTLNNHTATTKKLVELFKILHDPNIALENRNSEIVEQEIMKQLDDVKEISEDCILKKLLQLIKATLRTNYFQTTADGKNKSYITLKLNSQKISDLPLPRPLIDTFVYSSNFEGIHLRSHKISRGGIRWSNRNEDYRTEVLGLMKAQKVKNSVIIPSGAKGGFILKSISSDISNDKLQGHVIDCYKQFIRGLLDVTDNIKNNSVIHPKQVVCYDEDDTYLVVAADKGTATFSDIANEISREYSFWLGDAFASGGSNGYDHKKLGITARGAWESAKRHLLELDRANTEISVVGVGDMSGDVFGNGLIYSDKIKLIAAFDHRHIFLDPNPNIETSFAERTRLFNLPKSDWSCYKANLISSGGGVFSRTTKIIPISPEVKLALNISNDQLTPDELIQAILKAPVDLLFNGGIGTYVKSEKESSEQVGDKTNEYCRINGSELRCKIVCEGGNLGFTQLGRIEYALNGGLINTDFIDNAAGVDCSDHEVNLKILLANKLENKQISFADRNILLAKLEPEVKDLVLADNYAQALVMSYSADHSVAYTELYQEHIKKLEESGYLDRKIEYLPSDQEITERKLKNQGLTRPELAILLAYTKIYVKEEILKSNLIANIYFDDLLFSAFPQSIKEKFDQDIKNHYLRKEIIATQLSNKMINTMGISFPLRLKNETGASIYNISIAQSIAANIYNAENTKKIIQSLDNIIPIKTQYDLLHLVRQLLNMATRWFLRNGRLNGDINQITKHYQENIEKLSKVIPDLILGSTKQYLTNITKQFIESGLTPDIAKNIAISRVMYTALNICEVATTHRFDLIKTAETYFQIGGKFNLVWLRDFLAKDAKPGKQNNLARLTLRDDLDALQRRLSIMIMQYDPTTKNTSQLIDDWLQTNFTSFDQWQNILKTIQENPNCDYTALFIALRELSDMTDSICNLEKFRQLAYHDQLTNLPNRIMVINRIEELLKRGAQNNQTFAIHFIDLNKFKLINDTYGHQAGDNALIIFAKRLANMMKPGDLAGRIGGDEFLIIQTNTPRPENIEKFIESIQEKISKPMKITDQMITISASIGTAIYPLNGENSSDLIRAADKAMYANKLKLEESSVAE